MKSPGLCAKVVVSALCISRCGVHSARGTNAVRRPQPVCPRQPGDGYAGFCDVICGQVDHAERVAMAKMPAAKLRGATMVVTFHRERPGHVCETCRDAMREAGIVEVVLRHGLNGEHRTGVEVLT